MSRQASAEQVRLQTMIGWYVRSGEWTWMWMYDSRREEKEEEWKKSGRRVYMCLSTEEYVYDDECDQTNELGQY